MTTPAEELRTAAKRLRTLVTAVPSERWGNRPWHVEKCADRGFDECPCIVTQGEYKPFDQPQVPLIQYVADAETPEHAHYIAAMHPGVGAGLAELLEGCAELHEPRACGDGVKGCDCAGCQWCADEDFPCQDVRNALAVARAINGSLS